MDDRLDLIAFANGLRVAPDTPGGDADLMAFLIGDLCDRRAEPVVECLTNRRIDVLRHYDAAHYAELARRYGWPLQGGYSSSVDPA